MKVTNIRVSFMREKQPAQYEKAQPLVELIAVLEESDDHVVVARSLMLDAARVVYAGIGYDVPTKVAKALANGKVPPEATVKTDKKEADAEAPETVKAHEVAEAPKKRGRPVGSKNTAPKKGSKAAEGKAAADKATVADDGLPPEDGDTRQVSSNPEDRVNTDDGLPPEDDDTAPQKPWTAKDLHDLIILAVKKKGLAVQSAKQVLVHFNVARAQDLTDEQALEGKAMVEKMIEAAAK